VDDDENVVLVHQYRHPVQRTLTELPAGLLDVAGEPALVTAQRELAEEAGLAAREWHVLVDILNSPGMTDEAARVFLARGLTDVEREVQQHEEAELTTTRAALDDVVRAVLAGEYENGLLVAGVLAADRARASGWSGLRAADAPWAARPR
ncbi:MAG TPA: NUDIX hydrolase, partial [Mycobacteriales bacterium]|nr:NUDIX hydrolase [Mycobacteriales bacterium]